MVQVLGDYLVGTLSVISASLIFSLYIVVVQKWLRVQG